MQGYFFRKNSTLTTVLPIVLEGIEVTDCIKLLGVTLDPLMTFEGHILNSIRRASQRLYILKVMKSARLTSEEILTIYISMVRSILEYAGPLFLGINKK